MRVSFERFADFSYGYDHNITQQNTCDISYVFSWSGDEKPRVEDFVADIKRGEGLGVVRASLALIMSREVLRLPVSSTWGSIIRKMKLSEWVDR